MAGGLQALKEKYGERPEQPHDTQPWQKRWRNRLMVLGYLSVATALLVGLWSYRLYSVPNSGHMRPEYPAGTSVLVHKGYRRAADLHRGDCVIYRVAFRGRWVENIGRLVALPGEAVEYREGALRINGKPANEWYLAERVLGPTRASDRAVTLGPDEVYILNDDRHAETLDSRQLGPVKEAQLVGKVVLPFGAP